MQSDESKKRVEAVPGKRLLRTGSEFVTEPYSFFGERLSLPETRKFRMDFSGKRLQVVAGNPSFSSYGQKRAGGRKGAAGLLGEAEALKRETVFGIISIVSWVR